MTNKFILDICFGIVSGFHDWYSVLRMRSESKQVSLLLMTQSTNQAHLLKANIYIQSDVPALVS